MQWQTGLNEYDVALQGYQTHLWCDYRPGAGEAVLFVHGLACAWDSFCNALDRDYLSGRTLIFPDLIGYGDSSKPEDFSYSMEDQARFLDSLLALFPGLRFHIAAHSMGGAVALLLDAQTFARVDTFANLEGNLIREDCGILSRGISRIPYETFRDNYFPRQLAEFQGHDQLRFEKSHPKALHGSAVSLFRHSASGRLLERFRNLTCRKAYFFGEENRAMPVLNRMSEIDTIMISRSGHAMMTDNPEEFYTKLGDFIDSE